MKARNKIIKINKNIIMKNRLISLLVQNRVHHWLSKDYHFKLINVYFQQHITHTI